MDLLLGIDIGTGSTKGVVSTPEGQIVATASRRHDMSMPHPGWAEMDALRVWWSDVCEVSRELVSEVSSERIFGACISGLGPCLLLTDADLQPLRSAILYGIDMRAGREIEELTEQFGADEILANGGKALSSQAVGPKLAWVRRNEPDVWERAQRWFSSNSYIAARLTGRYVLDHHTASQCDPLYDIRANRWNTLWAAEVAPGLPLPELVWPSDVVGTVTEDASAETGLPTGTRVVAGTVDAWAESFSAGVRRPGDLMLMYGSTMFFVQALRSYRSHPKLWTTVGVEAGTYTLAAGMATSGSLTVWLQQLFGDVPYETLVAEAARIPAGAEGLVLLPYFAGERTPVFDPRARGIVAGLSLRHTRGHLFRAAYEGIAFGVRQILDFLDHDVDPPRRLIAVGGGTRGGLWTQIVSDVCDRTQEVPTETIGASYGDALLAAIGTQRVSSDTDWARPDRQVAPDSAARTIYDDLFAVYDELYPMTRDVVHRLSVIQEAGADASAAR